MARWPGYNPGMLRKLIAAFALAAFALAAFALSAFALCGCVPEFDNDGRHFACEVDSECAEDFECTQSDDLGRKICTKTKKDNP